MGAGPPKTSLEHGTPSGAPAMQDRKQCSPPHGDDQSASVVSPPSIQVSRWTPPDLPAAPSARAHGVTASPQTMALPQPVGSPQSTGSPQPSPSPQPEAVGSAVSEASPHNLWDRPWGCRMGPLEPMASPQPIRSPQPPQPLVLPQPTESHKAFLPIATVSRHLPFAHRGTSTRKPHAERAPDRRRRPIRTARRRRSDGFESLPVAERCGGPQGAGVVRAPPSSGVRRFMAASATEVGCNPMGGHSPSARCNSWVAATRGAATTPCDP